MSYGGLRGFRAATVEVDTPKGKKQGRQESRDQYEQWQAN